MISSRVRTAKALLIEIANRHRNSDLRMDHPDVSSLINGLLQESDELRKSLDTDVTANNKLRDPAIDRIDFQGPSPMDFYADFMKRYGSVIESHRKELHTKCTLGAGVPDSEMREAWAELNSLRGFEPDLHRLIRSFTAEAVKPLQDVLTSGRCGDFLVPGSLHICSSADVTTPEAPCKPL